jgi:hypothetical protein
MENELWTHSNQQGTVGHCFVAQIWDSNGEAIAELTPTPDQRLASYRAQLMAAAPLLKLRLSELVEAIEKSGDWSPDTRVGRAILNTDELLTILNSNQ